MADRWAVVISKPLQEQKAADKFIEQGVECFLPLMRKRKKVFPLFPRYLFAAFDNNYHLLKWTHGVQRVLAVVSNNVVHQVKARCDRNGVLMEDDSKFRIGQKVKTNRGLFDSQIGRITRLSENGRVEILMQILGRKTRVILSEDDLIAV